MPHKNVVSINNSPTSLRPSIGRATLAKAFGSSVTAVYMIDPYQFIGIGADFAYSQDQYLGAAIAEAKPT